MTSVSSDERRFGFGIGEAERSHINAQLESLLEGDHVQFVARSGDRSFGYFLLTASQLLGTDHQLGTARALFHAADLVDAKPGPEYELIVPDADGSGWLIHFANRPDPKDVLAWAAANSGSLRGEEKADRRLFSRDPRTRKLAEREAKKSGEWRKWTKAQSELRSRWTVSASTAQSKRSDTPSGRAAQRLADEVFATKRVVIFANGDITVGGLLREGSRRERLRSIEESGEVSRKSAVGRSAAAVLTVGTSWILSPGRRGDLYLTIITDANSYVLHQEPPTDASIKAAKKLVAVGALVLADAPSVRGRPGQLAPESPTSESVGDRLGKLKQLELEGLISRDEAAERRRSILGEI